MSTNTMSKLSLTLGTILIVILVVFLYVLNVVYHDLVGGLLYNIFIQGVVLVLGILIGLSVWGMYDEIMGVDSDEHSHR